MCGPSTSWGVYCQGPLLDGHVIVAGSRESLAAGVQFSEDEMAQIATDVYQMFASVGA